MPIDWANQLGKDETNFFLRSSLLDPLYSGQAMQP